jgi:putative tryptophan/tyrosine transport system substrate-binding protein
MRRREFISVLGYATTWPMIASAQQAGRTRRIGALMDIAEINASASAWAAAFEMGLDEAGWRKGRNCEIAYRWGASDPERLDHYAEELVKSAPDVFLVHGTPALIPLRKANTTIPIVFTAVSDPVGQGFVASLAHPGGNITGFSNYDPNIGTKWLQLLKEVAPVVTNVAVMFNSRTSPYNATLFMHSIEEAAPAFGVKVAQASILNDEDIRKTIAFLGSKLGSGLIVPSDPFTFDRAALITSLAMSNRLPAIYAFRGFAHAGGLLAYGVDFEEQLRKAAGYVNRIMNGESPSDLPVQAPTKYELVINLKSAKALNLDIPEALLVTADEVIE